MGLLRLLAVVLISALASLGASAHPHIFIDARLAIDVDDTGSISRLHHDWTFDAFFSAWIVQGLDTDGDGSISEEELQELADQNMEGLADYHFYTFADVDGIALSFQPLGTPRMTHDGERVTLSFGLSPNVPVQNPSRLELAVNDPEYYVAISFADPSDVRLMSEHSVCAVELIPPRPMSREVEEQLYALGPEVLELPAELALAMRGTQGMVVIDCDGGTAAASARTAAEALAQSRSVAPFGGPPPEPGLNLPRTGIFGWLQDQQRSFYAAMTGSLAALRADWTAFLVLGGLSFAYGVFHAAGPGHGKVVIGAYMLANERSARRGIALSFASAMLQSAVAIGFVLVAAGLIGLTGLAMADAANWIGIASYLLIMLLGLWLMVRKLFGHHHHYQSRRDMVAAARSHLDIRKDGGIGHQCHHDQDDRHRCEDHHHIVAPEVANKSWREQLGVVLAVGLRPCSGALVVLAFALSQGLIGAGILAVLLMGLGTGLTVAVLASIAVWGKALAAQVGGLDNALTARITWALEIGGAFAIFLFGLALLAASV